MYPDFLNHGGLMAWLRLAKELGYDERRMARRFGVTTRSLQRWWRRQEEGSLEEWLGEQRFLEAVQWLRLVGSVKEAAAQAGYPEAASFCREFKRWHGLTPGTYVAGFKARSLWWSDPELRIQMLDLQFQARQHAERRRETHA